MLLNSENDIVIEHKKDENDYLYISMTEIKWATPIAMATEVRRGERRIQNVEKIILMTVSWICHSIAGDRAFVHGQPNMYGRVNQSRGMVQKPYN